MPIKSYRSPPYGGGARGWGFFYHIYYEYKTFPFCNGSRSIGSLCTNHSDHTAW